MYYKIFPNRKAAQEEIEKMMGWDAKPSRLYLPEDPDANKNGNVWVIRCDGKYYLREDGFVR